MVAYSLAASQIASTTNAMTIAAHTAGVTRLELPLRGESLAAWLNSWLMAPFWPASAHQRRRCRFHLRGTHRSTAQSLRQSHAPSRWWCGFDGEGCAALTGSDAGKLSSRPASSFARLSRLASDTSPDLSLIHI